MKNIEIASLFKRIVAAVMDGLFAIFLYFILVGYVTTPIANKATKYQDYVLEIYQQEVSSHLYLMMQQDDTGAYVPVEVKDYTSQLDSSSYKKIGDIFSIESTKNEDYVRYLNYYYTVYKTGDLSRVELPSVEGINPNDYISPIYNVKIEGKLPKDIFTPVYFNTTIMGLSPEGETNTSPYFNYPVVDNVIDYEGLPVIKEGVDTTEVRTFLRNRVYDATKELYYGDYIASRQSEIKKIQLWTEVPVYVFVVGILYVLIPMLFKNGETLGKKTFAFGIISVNGYRAKKSQILLRSLVFVAEISLSLFIVGYGITSFATLGAGCVIMMAVVVFTKNQREPHDFVAMTLEVDLKKSVYFENANQEIRYEKQVQENIENLNKYEPENPNIIQVGSTIIDDRFKPKKDKKPETKKDEK